MQHNSCAGTNNKVIHKTSYTKVFCATIETIEVVCRMRGEEMPSYQINLVEDEKSLAQILKAYLEKEGWKVNVFTSGEDALEHIDEQCHLWILDIMLPGIDGYEVLKKIKNESNAPVIFISARDRDLDRVVGLELGGDDYLAKPFLPRELVIRSRKLLKLVYEQKYTKKVAICGYDIDFLNRKVSDAKEQIELTTKEMDVVFLLAEHENEILERETILHHVWGEDYFGSTRAVDDVIRRIRKKMPRLNLETIYGYGYRIVHS